MSSPRQGLPDEPGDVSRRVSTLPPRPGEAGDSEHQHVEAGFPSSGGEDLRQASLLSDAVRTLSRNPVFIVAGLVLLVLIVMAIFPQLFTNSDPERCLTTRAREPAGTDGTLLGYDTQGCPYYANIVYGARISMIIGVLVVGGALVIGVTLGALAGYYGGFFDSIMSRITDIFFGLPFVLGAIIVLQRFDEKGLLQVSLALVALTWMPILRLLRSSVIGIKDSDYVAAARALGASDFRIITRHILPNSLAPVLVYATIAVGGIIAAEATLSFLGVGISRPAISWGLQIDAARNFARTQPSLILYPSVALSITVLAFILLGDALRDALDPKLK